MQLSIIGLVLWSSIGESPCTQDSPASVHSLYMDIPYGIVSSYNFFFSWTAVAYVHINILQKFSVLSRHVIRQLVRKKS